MIGKNDKMKGKIVLFNYYDKKLVGKVIDKVRRAICTDQYSNSHVSFDMYLIDVEGEMKMVYPESIKRITK